MLYKEKKINWLWLLLMFYRLDYLELKAKLITAWNLEVGTRNLN